jgi:hypothetical protein
VTLSELATTFGPTLGFLIYLYVTRTPKAEGRDEAVAALRDLERRLIRIEAILEERK